MNLWATEYFKTAAGLMRTPSMGPGLGAALNVHGMHLPTKQPAPSSFAPGHIVPQMAHEPANSLAPSIAPPKTATALDYFASLG